LLIGDFNSDLRVDALDLTYLQGRLGASGATALTGDLSGDGVVDRLDVTLFVARYGRPGVLPPAPSAPAAAIAAALSSPPARTLHTARHNRRVAPGVANDAIFAQWPPAATASPQKLHATRVRAAGPANTVHLSDLGGSI
jgi:hypothetical protein